MKFFLLTFGIILILYDFGLGQSVGALKREEITRRIGDYWVWAEESKWNGLAAKDASIVLGWFRWVFGDKIVSFRSISLATMISIGVMLFILFAVISHVLGMPISNLLQGSIILFIFIVPNAAFDFLSLVSTIFLLRLMTKSTHIVFIGVYIILDIFILYFLAAVTYSLGTSVVLAFLDSLRPPEGGLDSMAMLSWNSLMLFLQNTLGNIGWNDAIEGIGKHITAFINFHGPIIANIDKILDLIQTDIYSYVIITSEIIIFTTAIPTILHLMILFVFIFSKVAPKPIQKIIGRVAQGFYESGINPIKIIGTVLIFTGGLWP